MKRLTAKQEKFAQQIAYGSAQTVAYREAGYDVSNSTPKSVWENASNLAALPKVVSRIEELVVVQQKAAEADLAWSKVDLVREAKVNLDLARTGGWRGVAPANGALTIIGQVTGLLSEKQQAATVTVTRITVVTTDSTVVGGEEIGAVWVDELRDAEDVPALIAPDSDWHPDGVSPDPLDTK